ncbi:bifunctional diaminohydroxyphosphoribosylaminopyrimidine deaminase/5-amino-6-(5-phosphoribosylamino)uracil reductase RibD [Flavitalea sp.]|nr:bifunctional diaminohydroxyphosphoribosylaminopyrimidine deaminase/5-amino-6-(5-phosphoribosylamino)uracil reductase RibD [Flavitalea sp.]
MDRHELYMGRAIELAKLGAGSTGPNPLVGAVLVYKDRVIGEGYHRKYGEGHAEVNCLRAVGEKDQEFIAVSTMYVTLEPCSHYGKTPPCTDLLISKGIKKVVIGSRDPFPAVNGKGIEKLKTAGIEVSLGLMEKECLELNKRFFTFHTRHRPYIILKWAQTADHFISADNSGRLMISNEYTNRLVHKWRSEEMSIMVGTNTAKTDNPSLTTRSWSGQNPVRLLIDHTLKLPPGLNLFNNEAPTIVFNKIKNEHSGNLRFVKIDKADDNAKAPDQDLLNVLKALYDLQITSVIVEGGRKLIQSFINLGYWDEARVITNPMLYVYTGITAPVLKTGSLIETAESGVDIIQYFTNSEPWI